MRFALVSHGPALATSRLETAPLGGSETALIQAAQVLADLGHEVSVFANCLEPGRHGGVLFQDLSLWPPKRAEPFDVLIVSRFHELLDRPGPVRLRVFWMHDILDRPERLLARLDRIDLIFCLSAFHLADTARRAPAAAPRLFQTRNGLDLDLIAAARATAGPRRLNQVVYSSRPERGLRNLLQEIWPALKARRPDLELKVCGYPIDESLCPPDLQAEYRLIDRLLARSPGVTRLGGLSKPELYRLLAESALLLYPCTFAETSCLAALEAQALDTPVLVSDRFALAESVVEPGFRVPGRPEGPEFWGAFVDRSLKFLTQPDMALELAARSGEIIRSRYGWPGIVREWLDLFQDRLSGRKAARPAPSAPSGPGEPFLGESFWPANRAALALRRPDLVARLEYSTVVTPAALVRGPGGTTLLKARDPDGPWRSLHGAHDPRAEARKMLAGLDPSPTELVLVLGFGAGHHLQELAGKLTAGQGLVVIEPNLEVLEAALHGFDLTGLLGRPELSLIAGRSLEETLQDLAGIQLQAGFPRLKTFIHRPSLKAMPQTHGRLAEELGRLQRTRIQDRLIYPKFQEDRARVLLFEADYFLLPEIRSALVRSGQQVRPLAPAGETMMKDLLQAVAEFRPDFLLTVNQFGFDQAGVLADFLSRIKLPFAAWYVDSPLLILGQGQAQANLPAWGAFFVWDRDYQPELVTLGAEHVSYLPLATDERAFRPCSADELAGRERMGLSFVGDSMQAAVNKYWRRAGLPEGLRPQVERAAEIYTGRADHQVRPALAQAGLLDDPTVAGFSAARLNDLSALVIWRATQSYRLKLIRALDGLGAVVVGDQGWPELLRGTDVSLRPAVDYYRELPLVYNLTEVNFNATSLQMKTGLNQRIFDVPASGGFLLTDQRGQLEDLFEPGQEAAVYKSPAEARNLADFYLRHPQARREIAARARRRVLAEHTYAHRIESLIQTMRRIYGRNRS